MEVILGILMALIAVVITLVALSAGVWLLLWLGFYLYLTDWTGEHEEAGPLPLSSPEAPIVRLVDTRRTMGGDNKRLRWDEGRGPVLAQERVKPLLESIPKELNDRLHATRNVPAKLYAPFRDTGTTYEHIYDAWGMVVSLNPDVLILSVHERPVGPHDRLPLDWGPFSNDQARRAYVDGRVECITGGIELRIYAGTLVPWSEEMYVFSTDPKVENGRLQFDNYQAEVPLPVGKLVLRHHGNDVDVTRQ